MKLARVVLPDGAVRVGVVEGDSVQAFGEGVTVLAAANGGVALSGDVYPLASVRLLAPIAEPRKILAIGFNYLDHIQEAATPRDPPAFPVFFNKQVTSLAGPRDAIVRPHVSTQLDYEGELAVVIGRRCRYVDEASALEVVVGYMVANDVSVRDWQRLAPTIMLGKSFDTHCPTGPWLVTRDEIPDPYRLQVRTSVGGETLQDFNTAAMIHSIARQIAVLSSVFTLEPGDIILTGTGRGVAVHRTPPRWLVPGEVVRVEITGLGAIENPVVDEDLVAIRAGASA